MSCDEKTAPTVRWITVDADRSGQRLDNFLIGTLKGVPRAHIYRIVRRGEIRINKGRRSAAYRLQAGDIVRIPPVFTQPPPPVAPELGWLEACVLFEDDYLLVLNKPSGMAVHGGSALSYGVIEALRALRPQARALELVHRLDRGTSGCLLIAKRRSALRTLQGALRDGRFDKRYLALLAGAWKGGTRTIDVPLLRTAGSERRVVVHRTGKAAISVVTPQRCFRQAVLVEVRLVTGRTHQVRVHMAHIGHPVVGDDSYGDARLNREWQARGARRMFLHAASLTVPHPATGESLRVEAPLPPDLADLVEHLDVASV
ncbi:MAG: RluA family pseudouridine synthase [Acidiferrobacter sp.]